MSKKFKIWAVFDDGQTRWANGMRGWALNSDQAKFFSQTSLDERCHLEISLGDNSGVIPGPVFSLVTDFVRRTGGLNIYEV